MSLRDGTNYEIPLSMHKADEDGNAKIWVDVDSDSSFTPSAWVYIHIIDDEHDSDPVNLTHDEAGLLYDRLGLILGRPTAKVVDQLAVVETAESKVVVVGEQARWDEK